MASTRTPPPLPIALAAAGVLAFATPPVVLGVTMLVGSGGSSGAGYVVLPLMFVLTVPGLRRRRRGARVLASCGCVLGVLLGVNMLRLAYQLDGPVARSALLAASVLACGACIAVVVCRTVPDAA